MTSTEKSPEDPERSEHDEGAKDHDVDELQRQFDIAHNTPPAPQPEDD